jgi:two-component system sensor histidine kinase CpxA
VRTLYARILLWCFGTLLFSLFAFFAISRPIQDRAAGRRGPFEGMHALELDQARQAYLDGGSARLAAYLEQLHGYFGVEHYLLDAQGRDLVSGVDRAEMLRAERNEMRGPPRPVNGRMTMARASSDGRFHLVVIAPPPLPLSNLMPYYLLVLAAVAVLCWVLAAYIASPLRSLAGAVDRFGRGDLSARVHFARRDEIGNLARSFNAMAERIETLLTAERRLLQDVSHELRSPLARLSFAAELTRNAPDRDAAVARMMKEIERLAKLVGALLEVTRAEGDAASRRSEDVRLDEIVAGIVQDCRLEAEVRGCRIAFDGFSPAVVCGDPELLRRAVENVLRNAVRYAPENSAVEVSLEARGESVDLAIRDYGPGVPDALLPKLFDPFFRVDDSRDPATGGVGLGLAIACRAVRLHHGELVAENAHPGLLVTMRLPGAAVPETAGVRASG